MRLFGHPSEDGQRMCCSGAAPAMEGEECWAASCAHSCSLLPQRFGDLWEGCVHDEIQPLRKQSCPENRAGKQGETLRESQKNGMAWGFEWRPRQSQIRLSCLCLLWRRPKITSHLELYVWKECYSAKMWHQSCDVSSWLAMGHPDYMLFLGVSAVVCPDIGSESVDSVGGPPQRGLASSNPMKAWTEQNSRGRTKPFASHLPVRTGISVFCPWTGTDTVISLGSQAFQFRLDYTTSFPGYPAHRL